MNLPKGRNILKKPKLKYQNIGNMESSMVSNRLKFQLREKYKSLREKWYLEETISYEDQLIAADIFQDCKKEILDVIYLRLTEIAGYKSELRQDAYDKLIKELLLESL